MLLVVKKELDSNWAWEHREELLLQIPPALDPLSPKEYGSRLRELRLEMDDGHYSLQDVASFIGCTAQHVDQIERGMYVRISKKWLPRFAQFYDCSCAYLLGLVQNKHDIIYDGRTYNFSVTISPTSEVVVISDLAWMYKRDPALFVLFLELSKSSPEKRKSGRDKLRELLGSKN